MSNMITLSPIGKVYVQCGLVTLRDTTDYRQSQNPGFTIDNFRGDESNPFNGVRIIRVKSPSEVVTLYSFADNIATNFLITEFLPVTQLDTEISIGNNKKYTFDLKLKETGTYIVSILSIPYSTQQNTDYDIGDISMFPNAPDRVIYKFNGAGFEPVFTDVDFTGIPQNYINELSVDVDCSVVDYVNCIFSKYEESYCGSCGCADICKNKKSNNILKATLLIREIHILAKNGIDYSKKFEQYEPILKILCHCS